MIHLFEPPYIGYHKRIWSVIRYQIILNALLFVVTIPLRNIGTFIPVLFASVLYLRARKVTIPYLSKLTIDTDEQTLEIELFKFDKIVLQKKTKLNACKVFLSETNLGLLTLNQIELHITKEDSREVIKQIEVGEWNSKIFKEIYDLSKVEKSS